MKFLPHASIDKIRWDECVQNSPNFLIYGLSWYLDVVSPNWSALVLGNYEAVMPLPFRYKYGIRYLSQPLFTQQLGVFGEADVTIFLQEAQKHFGYAAHINLQTEVVFPTQKTLQTHILALNKPYQELSQHYTHDRQQNLKRSWKEDWQRVKSEDIEPLIELFAQNHAQRIGGGVSAEAYPILRNLFLVIEQRGLSQLWYATQNGKIEAGIWVVQSGKRWIYLFNAASPKGRRGNARTWLLDAFFQQQAGQNLIFDFESPTIAPIDSFYESFGAEPRPFSQVFWDKFAGIRKWRDWLYQCLQITKP